MHCQQGGEVCACFGHLGVFGRCSNWLGHFLSSLVQGRSLDFCSLLHSRVALLHWFRGSVLWLKGSLHAGGALCDVRALVGGLRSLFEHGFVSDVSSRCPCLRGPRLVFFK
jgi:hypothetical protein